MKKTRMSTKAKKNGLTKQTKSRERNTTYVKFVYYLVPSRLKLVGALDLSGSEFPFRSWRATYSFRVKRSYALAADTWREMKKARQQRHVVVSALFSLV